MHVKNVIVDNVFINSIVKFSVSAWINFAISVVSVICMTRLFTPEVYGGLNIFINVSNVLLGVACLGLDNAFIRFYYELPTGWDSKLLLEKCILVSITALFGISFFAIVFFYEDISLLLFHQVNLYLIILIVINTLALLILRYFNSCYRMSNAIRQYTIQNVLTQFFVKLFSIIAAFISPSLYLAIAFNTIGLFGLMITYFFVQRKDILPSKFTTNFQGFKDVFKFGLYIWPVSIINYLNAFLISFFISLQLGIFELGIFSSALFFVNAFGVIQSGFRTYWATFMYKHYQDEQKKIIAVHNYVVLFSILVLGFFIIFQHIIYLLIGEQYYGSKVFFSLVLIDPLLLLIEQTTSYGINILKKSYLYTIASFLYVCINAVGAYFMASYFGLVGVGMSSACAAIFRFSLSTYWGQKFYQSVYSIKQTYCGIMIILCLAFSNYILTNEYMIEIIIVCGLFFGTGVLYYKDIKTLVSYIVE